MAHAAPLVGDLHAEVPECDPAMHVEVGDVVDVIEALAERRVPFRHADKPHRNPPQNGAGLPGTGSANDPFPARPAPRPSLLTSPADRR
jgi:hypothetical protein